jgi:hypothetical protein
MKPNPIALIVDSISTSFELVLFTPESSRVTVRGINTTTRGYWPETLPARMGGVSLPTNYLAMDLSRLTNRPGNWLSKGLTAANFPAPSFPASAGKFHVFRPTSQTATANKTRLQENPCFAAVRVGCHFCAIPGSFWARSARFHHPPPRAANRAAVSAWRLAWA